MFTNELLKEKNKAQQKIARQAKKRDMTYLEYVHFEAKRRAEEEGWMFKESSRKGGYLFDKKTKK
ncbi:hypothetical protein JW935_09375 [candidate division KSB1 bacterium]|nr:hypothetical protein [candidate division KSB1 bacterium]